MTRLLAATDLLPKSECAIDRAGLLADELGADLSLLHVVSPISSDRVLEQSLGMAIARLKSRVRRPLWHAAVTPEVIVRAGNPSRIIMNTLASDAPAALILGPRDRHSSFVDALAGTLVEKAVSLQKSPVLVVQQSASLAYRKVLLALDAAPASRSALRVAERLVLRGGAQATAIHARGADHGVLRPVAAEGGGIAMRSEWSQSEATEAMRALLEQESADPARYELVVDEDNPLRTIVRAIEVHEPDLLVVGTRGDGRMRRAVIGSVANQLLKIAACDVLIVPRGASEASLIPDAEVTAPSRAPMSV